MTCAKEASIGTHRRVSSTQNCAHNRVETTQTSSRCTRVSRSDVARIDAGRLHRTTDVLLDPVSVCDYGLVMFVRLCVVIHARCFRPACIFFFFFQAEDGIRDLIVTGVQTCALPICAGRPAPKEFSEIAEVKPIYFDFDKYNIRPDDAKILEANAEWLKTNAEGLVLIERSEERRVGKECRSRWSPYH